MAVSGDIHCPLCYRTNYERTTESLITHAGKGIFAMGVGIVGGAIRYSLHVPGGRQSGALMKGILKDGSYDYVCKVCGCKFNVEYKDNKVVSITPM